MSVSVSVSMSVSVSVRLRESTPVWLSVFLLSFRPPSLSLSLPFCASPSNGRHGFVLPLQARTQWLPNETPDTAASYQDILLQSEYTLAPAGQNTEFVCVSVCVCVCLCVCVCVCVYAPPPPPHLPLPMAPTRCVVAQHALAGNATVRQQLPQPRRVRSTPAGCAWSQHDRGGGERWEGLG